MNPTLKTALKIIGGLVAVVVVLLFIMRYNTKAHSPEDTVQFESDGLKLEVLYSRPYKKDREIFGALVPYDEVWRTGANEATTFETNKDILVDGSLLKAGKYTLWTIPGEKSWKVIFNSQMYPWGIDVEKKAYRDPEYDTLVIETAVNKIENYVEQFTIFFEEINDLVFLFLSWDDTSVSLPIKEAEGLEIPE
ncbi:DUF2911 domain-containing protein [Salegentibacter sp. F188]|uniref:DUF2911 domain-containing protein n=1 Tax=Autumnicola patrickiae TaxID=3075591 RepID=A0ABU3E0S9_9FLAO|nr:DUF2911 domain-containing protein [Salegentibacter sp. F188]MDT0689515.1 DUF2911 domain-containing protein [Salegentibacter sp. F188]